MQLAMKNSTKLGLLS